jgi:nitrogen regulatory protein P-II 1
MKLIKAIIRREKLHDVLHALYDANVHGMTVSDARGHGGEPEREETYRGARAKRELKEKVVLDIGVSEDFVEPTVNAIMDAARTGEVGDGKIFVQPLEAVYRIRTGERDQAAVTPVTRSSDG